VGISLRRHITCLLGVACDGGEAPAARAAGGVKCLVGAVNLFRNGEDCGARLGCGALAGFVAVTCRPQTGRL